MMLLGMTCISSSSVIFVGHTDQLQCNRSDLWIVCLLCVKHNLCKPSTQTATASSITWSSSTLFRYQTISQEPITRIIKWLPISIPKIPDCQEACGQPERIPSLCRLGVCARCPSGSCALAWSRFERYGHRVCP